MVEAINAMPTQRSKARVWNIHVVFEPPTPPTSRPAQRPHGRCFTRGRPRWPGTTLLSQQAVERRCRRNGEGGTEMPGARDFPPLVLCRRLGCTGCFGQLGTYKT